MGGFDPRSAFIKAASTALETAGDVVNMAADAAGTAVEAATNTATQINEAATAASQKVMESIYRPLFPEEFTRSGYVIPKMIAISNGSERRDIEVCKGAIGWSDTAAGVDVLHLYEENVPYSGIVFCPQALCDSIYYEDPQTPGRYISMESYFDTLEKDKITELRRIAYELGAKSCKLESIEEAKSLHADKAKVGANQLGSIDGSCETASGSFKRIVFSQTFEGNAEPTRPDLKWFANDQEIEFLISTRCNAGGANKTKSYRVELDSSSTQTMSVQLAGKLDKAISKLGATCNFSLRGEALNESHKRLVFEVDF